MVAAPGMLLIAGKKLKEACAGPMPYPRDSCAIVTRPINLASSRKRLQLLCPFPILSRIWTRLAREVGRFERFVFLFLAFVYKAFYFCFFWGGQ